MKGVRRIRQVNPTLKDFCFVSVVRCPSLVRILCL